MSHQIHGSHHAAEGRAAEPRQEQSVDLIRPVDRERLRESFRSAEPFPHIVIEDFLDPDFAEEVAKVYPSFEEASAKGFGFDFVNERRKVQITNPDDFPEPVHRLHEALQSESFLELLSDVTGIPNLLADEKLVGGGVHVTGPQGRLDVHADFNLLRDRGLFRRLNLLLYLNTRWDPAWGGEVELWDRKVKHRRRAVTPALNRCLIFETSDHSFHGVAPVRCPEDTVRKSFAAYYYTREAPPGWDGAFHSTIFRARPDERFRRYLLMPAERARKRLRRVAQAARRRLPRGA